jgi:hypothetical protein
MLERVLHDLGDRKGLNGGDDENPYLLSLAADEFIPLAQTTRQRLR